VEKETQKEALELLPEGSPTRANLNCVKCFWISMKFT